MTTALSIENVSKQYRLGLVGTGTLAHDLNRWWCRIRGLEDPYSLVGQVNNPTEQASGDYVWALKDVSFEVQQGEVVGLIGKNGAGKSTLLKLISRITTPTTGCLRARGRIGALLEVGTGMHPEMTARENIFLNGALLGMKRHEIHAKFDDIVDFAGCAMYVDTPVKRYSSGMRVRLGFAVAAFLEPEILIVDEVLAVGDYEFQKKAIEKMKEVTDRGGRTVLFVSHNMTSIKSICQRGIVLDHGGVVFDGDVDSAVTRYRGDSLLESQSQNWDLEDAPGNDKLRLRSMTISPLTGAQLDIDSGIGIEMEVEIFLENSTIDCTLELRASDETVVLHQGHLIAPNRNSKKGRYRVRAEIPPRLLNSGKYFLTLIFGENLRYPIYVCENSANFEIEHAGDNVRSVRKPGVVFQELMWHSQCEE